MAQATNWEKVSTSISVLALVVSVWVAWFTYQKDKASDAENVLVSNFEGRVNTGDWGIVTVTNESPHPIQHVSLALRMNLISRNKSVAEGNLYFKGPDIELAACTTVKLFIDYGIAAFTNSSSKFDVTWDMPSILFQDSDGHVWFRTYGGSANEAHESPTAPKGYLVREATPRATQKSSVCRS